MALQKNNININFARGLDLKTDPWQVQPNRFLALNNSIFTKAGRLSKRNGFGQLPSLFNAPDTPSASFISTFKDNLVAIGNELSVLSTNWIPRGTMQSVDLSVVQLIRASLSAQQTDAAIASNGLVCTIYLDATPTAYYQISDAATGQIIVSQTTITGAHVPRVFALGNYFVITFFKTVSATPHLQYIAIPINNPSNPGTATDISTSVHSVTTGYDGISVGESLYIAWQGADGGGSIRATFLDSNLNQHNTLVTSGSVCDLMSVTVDFSGTAPVLWMSFWDASGTDLWTAAFTVSNQLQVLLAPTPLILGVSLANITSTATGGTVTIFYERINDYPSPLSSVRSDFITTITCSTIGLVGVPVIILRGVALAGKAFYLSSTGLSYMLVAYTGAFQPVFFLIDESGHVIGKLAYENAAAPSNQVLPNANVSGASVSYAYLYKFIAVPLNPAQGIASPSNIYGQTGVNLATFTVQATDILSQEIAGALHITGGIVWMYDGNVPVEHGFLVFPEDVGITTTTGAGGLIAQQYYYYFVYAWTDAAGNVHRSAPSIPYGQVTTTSSSHNTLNIPTYRQTYKVSPNSVRIEIYRWSAAQEVPYLITSQTAPTLNDPTVDTITYVDSDADSAIIGNEILYTFGGTVEDIAAPAASGATLFKSRMFVIDAEDPNTIWYSKVVIEQTPVEFSDLFTLFVAPTLSAQGPTGSITALSAMDDKLIVFKKNALYYFTGNGPDNTGANSDYGDPVFISATAGCTNARSIVLTPQGLMFQSDKGIWLLGRDLSTTYIGAAVEDFNDQAVLSALTVPGTNQVRFTMSGGMTLMYDYYFNEWGTFSGIPGVTSTIYQGLHTFLNSLGQVFQESPGKYLDGAQPVLLSFTTAWLNLAGLQGYQRAYEFYLLAQYLSPHKLILKIANDYNPAPTQQVIISPDNFSGVYGSDSPFGEGSPFGGPANTEDWRVFITQQKCQSIQISLEEQYDGSFGVPAGAGLTLSGINLIYGMIKNRPRLPVYRQAG